MKSRISALINALAAIGLLSTFVAYSPDSAAADADPAHTFTFRLNAEPETLDWNRAHTPIETYVLMNLMEGLVGMDEHLKPVPLLAESWTMSDGGKVYTFHLRPGVKWSDGVPLKAADFVYSWKRLLAPITAAPYAYLLFDVEGGQAYNSGKLKDFSKVGIKAVDDQTFQVTLTHAMPYWIFIPTFWVTFPMREDIVERNAGHWDTPGSMVSLGPFTYESHDFESKILLKRNPLYWGKHGNVEQAVGLIVKDDSTAVTLYESGKLDFMIDLPSTDLQRLAKNPDLKTFPYLKTGYLAFVIKKYPISNVHFRRAIAMAIDKSQIGNLLHGGQTPATSFIPPQVLGYSKTLGLPFNPAEAKKELQLLGSTENLAVDILLANWDKPMVLAQFIQEQLKKNLGVNVTLNPFDHKTFRSQLELRTFSMYLNSWSADYPDPDNFIAMWQGSSGNNRTDWKSPKFDKLVEEGSSTQNPAQRIAKYTEAQKILQEEDTIVLPLFYEPNMALVRGRVKGLELNALNYLYLRKINLE